MVIFSALLSSSPQVFLALVQLTVNCGDQG